MELKCGCATNENLNQPIITVGICRQPGQVKWHGLVDGKWVCRIMMLFESAGLFTSREGVPETKQLATT